MKKQSIARTAAVLLFVIAGGVVMLGLFGCDSAREFSVDFRGGPYEGARSSYREGETVTVRYGPIATDTDYTFTLDGKELSCDFDSRRDMFVISFVMPSRDAVLECTSERTMRAEVEPDILLIDYFSATVGLEDGGDSYEITLSTYSRERQLLSVYVKPSPDGEEERTDYLVPADASEKCYRIIYERGLNEWNELDDPDALDGVRVAVKYRDGSDYTRVSTDAMPRDGLPALEAVREALEEYVKDEYLVPAE